MRSKQSAVLCAQWVFSLPPSILKLFFGSGQPHTTCTSPGKDDLELLFIGNKLRVWVVDTAFDAKQWVNCSDAVG